GAGGGQRGRVVRSGGGALAPAAHASGTTAPSVVRTRRYSSQVTRPRSSTGKPERAARECGRTPVVHTSVVAANFSPVESRMIPPSAESRRGLILIFIPPPGRRRPAYHARPGARSGRRGGVAGRRRWVASISTQRACSPRSSG